MLIGLMSLPSQVVYIQFHPVAYMVKLNIEMSMAQLITKLARGSVSDRDELENNSSSNNPSGHINTHTYGKGTIRDPKDELHLTELSKRMGQNHQTSAVAGTYSKADRETIEGIHTKRDIHVMVEDSSSLSQLSSNEETYHTHHDHSISASERRPSSSKDDDDVPLKKNGDSFEAPEKRFNSA